MGRRMKKILSIAGSDCSGGAGIQADLKTIEAFGMFGMSVITALVAENTYEVKDILQTSIDNLSAQCDCVFRDIFPDAVKIGMTGSESVINLIADKLAFYKPKNIVFDPVMVATSGKKLFEFAAVDILKEKLLPYVDILTPNLKEAEVLANCKISGQSSMIYAAERISNFYDGVILIKGGHLNELGNDEKCTDLIYCNGKIEWLECQRISNPNTHGTGCTLSAAITCGLAAGLNYFDAIKQAKNYLCNALLFGLNLGHGSGPLYHKVSLN